MIQRLLRLESGGIRCVPNDSMNIVKHLLPALGLPNPKHVLPGLRVTRVT